MSIYIDGTMLLDSKLFPAFAAAAKAGSFTEAAKRVNMTQPGISQHISKLESQIGYTLFKRSGKKVILTEAGRNLLYYLEDHMSGLQDLFDTLHQEASSLSGMISVCMSCSSSMIPKMSTVFQVLKENVNISLNLMIDTNDVVEESVERGKVHFGIMNSFPRSSVLTNQLIYREELILVGGRAGTIGPTEVMTVPFISYPGSDLLRSKWLTGQALKRSDSLEGVYTSGSLHGALSMVRNGLGYSIVPRHCVRELIDECKLFEIHFSDTIVMNNVYLVLLSDFEYPARVKKICNVLTGRT